MAGGVEDQMDDIQMAFQTITDEEIEVVRSSLDILLSIADGAKSVEDMKTEIATDIY